MTRNKRIGDPQRARHGDGNSGKKPRLRVCSFESRRAAEMQSLIERHGGIATVAPSMQETPLEHNPAAYAFAESLLRGEIDVVVFMTGVGAATLLDAIQLRYEPSQILRALARPCIIVRGPKPLAVLRGRNIRVDHRAPEPNTWRELIATIDAQAPIEGKRVAVQEYGVANTEFYEALGQRGARVIPVPVYRWSLPDDVRPLTDAIKNTIAGEFDVLTFTSANQLTNVLQVAESVNLRDRWVIAARRCLIASIGPTMSEALSAAGLEVDVEASPPKMGQLVRAVFETATQLR